MFQNTQLTRRNLICLNDGKINKALVYSILNENAAKHLEQTIIECFHVRDHRNGLGEREVGRLCFNWMADVHPHIFIHAMKHIPLFGRWDDLLYIKSAYMRPYIYDYIHVQFQIDMLNMKIGKEISLLAKWLPTEGKSWARKHKTEFNQLLACLKMEPKEYRQTVSILRKRLDLPEHYLCSEKARLLSYDKMNASKYYYRKTLYKRDYWRYSRDLQRQGVKPPTLNDEDGGEGGGDEGVENGGGEGGRDLRYKSIIMDLKINVNIE
jgi:hypothetical protein